MEKERKRGKNEEKETPMRKGIFKGTAHGQFRKGTTWKCKLGNLFSLHCCGPQSIWSH